jgi:hypothetical protein
MPYPPALSVARSVRTANESANEALRKRRVDQAAWHGDGERGGLPVHLDVVAMSSSAR